MSVRKIELVEPGEATLTVYLRRVAEGAGLIRNEKTAHTPLRLSETAIKVGIQNRNCDGLSPIATFTALSAVYIAHKPTAGFIAPAETRVFAKAPTLSASRKGK
jgi:hypothetical protein